MGASLWLKYPRRMVESEVLSSEGCEEAALAKSDLSPLDENFPKSVHEWQNGHVAGTMNLPTWT